ncbi:hypothetical protein GK047_12020 [Paenibacillus sp. SYP-B3998]|uniref:Uncharacterized protein n=1 Tax=Paenibacillus sp. SYP-B3998 TaxID=2678564 RepID=A0A6G3ZYT7_9BACL|nr:hypothetical protein [Paenibacillus sp. SYP-B3998]NEW06741.1 hypothetical protein [Paenibacillus sp. SYP-B3998]
MNILLGNKVTERTVDTYKSMDNAASTYIRKGKEHILPLLLSEFSLEVDAKLLEPYDLIVGVQADEYGSISWNCKFNN